MCWKWKSNPKKQLLIGVQKKPLSTDIPGDHSPKKRLGWPTAHFFPYVLRVFVGLPGSDSSHSCAEQGPAASCDVGTGRGLCPDLGLFIRSATKNPWFLWHLALGVSPPHFFDKQNFLRPSEFWYLLWPAFFYLFFGLFPLWLRQILAHCVCKWNNCKLAWWGRSGKAQALLRPAAAGTSPWFWNWQLFPTKIRVMKCYESLVGLVRLWPFVQVSRWKKRLNIFGWKKVKRRSYRRRHLNPFPC